MSKRLLAVMCMLSVSLGYVHANAGQGKGHWIPVENNRVAFKGERMIQASSYLSYHLDVPEMAQLLYTAKGNDLSRRKEVIVSIPMPDGSFQDFQIFPSAVMHPDLAAKYPEIQAYDGKGITDPYATAKFDVTPFGFHAMILSPQGTTYIDPYSLQDPDYYMVYRKSEFINPHEFVCLTKDAEGKHDEGRSMSSNSSAKSVAGTLKEYRLALATTGEYSAFFGNTKPQVLAAMVTAINRVTGIYERELCIRLTLIANTDTLIYLNPSTDPYTNNDGGIMLGQNQTTVQTIIGGTNYDIGHVFSTGGGGIAGLGVVCYFTQKANGVTGLPSPVGDPFYVDYVAHEMGHQFGGNHTFNCELGSCQGNRSPNSAYEPGSGSTIMAYAGICGSNNLQSNSNDYFHTKSFDEIIIYTTTGIGGNCPTISTTFNNAPVINVGSNYIIPYLTPFRLTGSATDPDNDPMTYCWEQYNTGPAGVWNNPTGNAPIFRSFNPVTTPVRLFPKLSNILANNQTIGEVKPSYARTLSFKLTVRDNKLNGGGVTNNDTPVQVHVINTGTPFAVTSPNVVGIIWQSGGVATVTWDVGGSDLAPISTPNVNILLSTDGGQTFPTVLAQTVPNNGSYNVNVPSVLTTTARVMVEGDGNIFFDINDKNFEIGTVGINEYNNSNGVFIGPNPVHDEFEIIVKDNSILQAKNNHIEIFDVTGRFITSAEINSERYKINVRDWSNGIYMYRFMNENGVVSTGKIIVD